MEKENGNSAFDKEPGKFGLPKDYFQKSANSIKNKIEWQEEHKNFPQLTAFRNERVFSLLPDYFSKKEKELELILYPVLSSIKGQHPFLVPKNYFEELKNLVTVELLEQNNDPDLVKLNSVKKQNNFRVPEDYFSKKEAALKQIPEGHTKTKILPLFSKRIGYAAAALVIMILGVWLYNIYFTPVQPLDCGTIACLDKQDLVKTKNLERLDDEQLFELVDPAALEKKLANPDTKPDEENRTNSLKDDSLNDLLDDI